MNAFFQWEQELRRLAFLTNTQSPLGKAVASSLGYAARNFTPGSAPQRKPSNKRLVPFFAFCGPISGVEIWTQNWVHQVAQQLKSCRKLDPVFGPPKLAWFVPGASLLQPFFPMSGDSFLADGSLRGCQVCKHGGIVWDETSVQEHLRASAVRPQQAAAFDEQPFQFPRL